MTRWTLNRAGILNVYQYGDETLSFGGGRLLLRGVNGSGKSTAMNMLLPFLLDADPRRIDAAGEQSSVLRGWMLSGRDEQQPVGYLWLEMRDGDGPEADHLVFGCGIRANRSTDRVTTWWFITHRRPGIDLSLLDARTPLSVDALRAELGSNAVFTHEQRAGYRAEIRRRLFGGADIDQHVRLLHIVRNPRVGDRIDIDLPTYLSDALPQLSETALDDAAQPLEDLEEHRHNVEELTRTATALDALDTTYGNYVRTELHARADAALAQASAAQRLDAILTERRNELTAAETAAGNARAEADRLEHEVHRLALEIDALRSQPAYQEGSQLNDLREHVSSLDAEVAESIRGLARQSERAMSARESLAQAHHQSSDDLRALTDQLSDLRRLAEISRSRAAAPDVPSLTVVTIPDPQADHVRVPEHELEVASTQAALAALRAAVHARTEEVREIRRLLDNVERAQRALGDAERLLADAEAAEEQARAATVDTRAERDRIAGEWRNDMAGWTASLHEHARLHAVSLASPPAREVAELIEQRSAVADEHIRAAQRMIDRHGQAVATLRATQHDARLALDEREQELALLAAMALPDPPLAIWQVPAGHARLAECIDFAPAVDETARAGIEAALEASSLLAAEITADGDALVDGQLLVRAGEPVAKSLADLLVVTVPAGVRDGASTTIERVLHTISIDAHDLDRAADCTVITTDGRFRLGPLRGRHHKSEAEHIGVTARRALLERRRAEAHAAVALAADALATIDRDLAVASDAARLAIELRDAFPSVQPLDRAVLHVAVADTQLVDAGERTERHREVRADAELALVDANAVTRRAAATADLPHERVGLDHTEVDLRDTTAACGLVDAALVTLARSVRLWSSRGDEWQRAADDAKHTAQAHEQLQHRRESVATRLATLEDAVGLAYREILAAIDVSTRDRELADNELRGHRGQLPDLQERVGQAREVVNTAVRDHEAAEDRCAQMVDALRRTLEVPGLVDSARLVDADADADADEPESAPLRTLPAVERNANGLQSLARRIRAEVVAPERPTSADGVRGSLRQRRDALGAGWDAEDRQPSTDTPLLIEVTGPLGRMPLRDSLLLVRGQVRTMTGLLSAKQDQALRNLLQGLIAREVAEKLLAARDLVALMNRRLDSITTAHGIGVSLRWSRRDDLDPALSATIGLLSKRPDLRTADENTELLEALSTRIANARAEDPDAPYRQLISSVLDYREWHHMRIILRRPGRDDERLTRRTALSEGEKKVVSYLPLFAAVAASCDALAALAPDAPRFVLLDDAFAKVSEDNHPKLFGLLVELDLDFIATSERLWGTYATVPQLAITEVIRDAGLGVIVLEHAQWDGHVRVDVA